MGNALLAVGDGLRCLCLCDASLTNEVCCSISGVCLVQATERSRYARVLLDIEHLVLGKVPLVESSRYPIVAVGKHLCGVATDSSLVCLAQCPSASQRVQHVDTAPPAVTPSSASSASLPTTASKRPRLVPDSAGAVDSSQGTSTAKVSSQGPSTTVSTQDTVSATTHAAKGPGSTPLLNLNEPAAVHHRPDGGVTIALCCHQVCTWSGYCNQGFFTDVLGFSPREFKLIALMSSWYVCRVPRACVCMRVRVHVCV